MKTILILRHAKSSWDQPELDDRQRPLNARGLKAAPRVGELLRKQGLLPDLILSSNAVRAQTTARLVAEAAGCQAPLELHPEFYGAPTGVFYAVLAALPETVGCVLLVGHNPDLEELVEALSGRFVSLSTAALVQIELPLARWTELEPGQTGTLVNFWRPGEPD